MSRQCVMMAVALGVLCVGLSAEARTPDPQGWARLAADAGAVSVWGLHPDERERLMAGVEAVAASDGASTLLPRTSSLVPWRLRRHDSWVVLTEAGPVVAATRGFSVAFDDEGLRLSIVLEGRGEAEACEGPAFPMRAWSKFRGHAAALRPALVLAPTEAEAAALWSLLLSQIPRTLRVRMEAASSPARIQQLPASLRHPGDRIVIYDAPLAEGDGEIADATRLRAVFEVSQKAKLRRVVVPPTPGDARLEPLHLMDLVDRGRDAVILALSGEGGCEIWLHRKVRRRWQATQLDRRPCAP